MRNNKGQAAMEFLMTYGWAILAAIIAIGVLAYFGVFSPGKYAPSATVVNPPFYAQGAVVSVTEGNIKMELKNNGGDDLNVTSMAVTPSVGGGTCTTNTTTVVIPVGITNVTLLGCTDLPTSGKTFKGDIVLKYRKVGSTLDLTSTGSITQTTI